MGFNYELNKVDPCAENHVITQSISADQQMSRAQPSHFYDAFLQGITLIFHRQHPTCKSPRNLVSVSRL